MESGVEFDYHNFGPFSTDVAIATDDAASDNRLRLEVKPGFHEVPYTLYATDQPPPRSLRKLLADEASQKLNIMDNYSALEMEVAATIVYLRGQGYGENAVEETRLRKPIKATRERVERSLRLIRELSLD
jgi:hypothetical protein